MKNMSGGRWRSWDFPCFPMCGKGKWVLRSFQTIAPSLASPVWLEAESSTGTFSLRAAARLWEKSKDSWKESTGEVKRIVERERVKSLKGGEILVAVLSQSFQEGTDYTELLRSISILPPLKKPTGCILHYFSRFFCI